MKTIWRRRDFLFRAGGGISGLALAHLLNQDGLLAASCDAQALGHNPYAPKPPHFKPRAKSVISLFMCGGASHIDTFDPKPPLEKHAGQPLTGKGKRRVRPRHTEPLRRTPVSVSRT